MLKKFYIAITLVVALIGLGIQPAKSALTGKGLINPITNFPSSYSDAKGVSLELCLDGDGVTGLCFFDPVIPGNTTSETSGFGAEAFWWRATSTLNLAGGGQADLVLGLEAAYASGDPAPNDQITFGRVRIRVDVPVDGDYKIWHPALSELNGCQPEVYTATAGIKGINVTRDIGGPTPFDGALSGEVGPFLTWDPAIPPAAPAGFIGDPAVNHKVVGGHCGINFFRIEAPAGVDLDGAGHNFVQTNLFSVLGKIFNEADVPPGIESVRATYTRRIKPTTGNIAVRINTWVKAPPTATITLSGLPKAIQDGAMTFDGDKTFFKRGTFAALNNTPVPTQLTVTASNAAGSNTQAVNVVDVVTIQSVSWAPKAQTLKVVAISSDKISPTAAGDIPPELTLQIGQNTFPMRRTKTAGQYVVSVPSIAVPPAFVTVTSSKGGVGTAGMND
ncbi:hypothetical protein [Nitrosomonas sp. Nm33]|uniref:hypothetical protein n=1 Tax=Nitrosomonas sp. Nm33 TaxID=133724 RepID=UPI00089B8A0B|nr:hypothetical protein [Nitrosomonas sp. Nm33]SDY85734.1 hypothetical protein SAMN05421755_10564 [Nitrosomonas sp. Nm33]